MIDSFLPAPHRAKSWIVNFFAIAYSAGVTFSVNWYDMMAAPLGGVA